MKQIIENITQYIKWLDDNYWLDDVIIEDIQLLPHNLKPNEIPKRINLKCKMQLSGSYKAGEIRTIREYNIIFNDVKEYSLSGKYIKENCCEGVEEFDHRNGIIFNIFVPGNLLIACDTIEIINQIRRRKSTIMVKRK